MDDKVYLPKHIEPRACFAVSVRTICFEHQHCGPGEPIRRRFEAGRNRHETVAGDPVIVNYRRAGRVPGRKTLISRTILEQETLRSEVDTPLQTSPALTGSKRRGGGASCNSEYPGPGHQWPGPSGISSSPGTPRRINCHGPPSDADSQAK